MRMEGYHKSVLLKEVLGFLDVQEGAWYVDGTLGDAGYSLGIFEKGGNIVGIDQDPEAIKRAKERLEKLEVEPLRYKLVKGNFREMDEILKRAMPAGRQVQDDKDGVQDDGINGVVLDLGVSSLQLEEVERGFSFSKEAPLDMRMDPELGVRAMDLVNGLHKGELIQLFERYGENTDRRVVNAILQAREQGKIETTTQLATIIEKAVGRGSGIHPATTIFQALRIAVNDELNSLEEALPKALEILQPGGKIVVVSFHSLEDRIVKKCFNEWMSADLGWILTDKPIEPREEEITGNPRSRSAKLRAFRKN